MMILFSFDSVKTTGFYEEKNPWWLVAAKGQTFHTKELFFAAGCFVENFFKNLADFYENFTFKFLIFSFPPEPARENCFILLFLFLILCFCDFTKY